jgi:hypothetical protein
MEEVKMMLSHDKQHLVNIQEKKEHYNQHHGGERDWRKMPLTTPVIKL